MCGFVLIKGKGDLAKALAKIAHRGPDDSRIKTIGDLRIGFQRLAIVDKSERGMQPFLFKRWIGVFVGEIYNYEYLREKYDLTIDYQADTAVILPLFELMGPNVIEVLDGFYSGVIYDKTTKKLYSLRDHIGKKPLLYGKTETGFFVTNELKAIADIQHFEVLPLGFSLIKEKVQVLKRHQLQTNEKELAKLLAKAVEKRLPNEDFGVFLSGGIDSSIVSLLVKKASGNLGVKVHFYALANEDSADYQYIIQVKEALKIDNLTIISLPKKEAIPELIEKIVYHTESYNPSVISNGLATYLLSKQAHADGLKVVLTGEGADEVFCGYKNCVNAFRKAENWQAVRTELLENLHFTELRRTDNSTMANAIEVRCPFLDREVVAFANSLTARDFFWWAGAVYGKAILRKTFQNALPDSVIYRDKTSCDVGSGIRRLVVEELTKDGRKERAVLKDIWLKFFKKELVNVPYFHAYPSFDAVIDKRSSQHSRKENIVNLEQLIQAEFEKVAFHNLFMLNKIVEEGSEKGGTCSDKTLHFKKVLEKHKIPCSLHSAFIGGTECHRLLKVCYQNRDYFIDIGTGWPSIKAFPLDEMIEYEAYGIGFKSEMDGEEMVIWQRERKEYRESCRIPMKGKSEAEILADIAHRYDDLSIYPFRNELRFSIIKDDGFYYFRGRRMYRYSEEKGVQMKELSKDQIREILTNQFKFKLAYDWKY